MAGPAAPMSKNSAPVFCIAADVCVDEKRKKEEEEKKRSTRTVTQKWLGVRKKKGKNRTGEKNRKREKTHFIRSKQQNIVIIVNTHTETGRTQ